MPPLGIAALTAAAAILGTALGAFASVRVARIKAQTDENLELLRFRHQQTQPLHEFATAELIKGVELADTMNAAIQRLRDRIRKLSTTIDLSRERTDDQNDSADPSCVDAVAEAASIVVENYTDSHPALSPEIRGHAHKAKAIATGAVGIAELLLRNSCGFDIAEAKEMLARFEQELGEQQRLIWAWTDGARSTAALLTRTVAISSTKK